MDRVGQRFGDYLLIRLIGQGGFADVYLGEHLRRKTLAAVKVLHMRLAHDNVKDFLNEARSFRLKHPHIVQILDFGLEDDYPFLVMEYAPNGSLRQRHPGGTQLSLETIVFYVRQIADALQYAHEEGVVHRDIKPDNMLLGRQNEVLLSDFGIASIAHSTQSLNVQDQAGTVTYMAPEQLQGKPRPASDQYALGVVVYEWICGERPFRGSFAEIYGQHLSVPPLSLRERIPALSSEVEEVVMTALAKDPRRRFANVQAFANALEQACKLVPPARQTSISQLVSPLNSLSQQPSIMIPSGLNNPIQPLTPEQPSSILAEAPDNGANAEKVAELLDSFREEASIAEERNWRVSSPQSPLPEVFDHTRMSNSPVQEDTNRHEDIQAAIGTGLQSSIVEFPLDHPKETNDVPATVMASLPAAVPETYAISDMDMAGNSERPVPIRRKRRKILLFSLLCIIVVMLIVGITFASIPGGLGSIARVLPGVATTANVTITPVSKDLATTYELFAVTGTPDPAKREVGARIISATSATQTKTVGATGSIKGIQATGQLTFLNTSNSTKTFSSVVLTGASGVPVSFNGPITVPAVPGFMTTTGFALNVGVAGDIRALDISGSCCAAGITVKNGAFGGGRDPQLNAVIQQSDIDGAASALVTSLTPGLQAALQKEIHANELPVTGSFQCTKSTFTADHKAGDIAKTVTVTVAVTCKQEVYDQQGALAMAANLLKTAASQDPGPAYALTGDIVTGVTSAKLVDSTSGTVALLVRAEGVWVYQFSDTIKQGLANHIANMSKDKALSYLLKQPGVTGAQVDISSGNTLPDAGHITINVKPVPGATGTGTPATGTPTTSPGSPTAIPTGTLTPTGSPTAVPTRTVTPSASVTPTPTAGLGGS